MNELLNTILYESWSWYIGGPLIGVFAIVVLIIERKSLGVSTSFEHFCSVAIPSEIKRNLVFRESWQIWFVSGMILGGLILHLGGFTTEIIAISEKTLQVFSSFGLTDHSGYAPAALYTFAFPQVIILFAGGLAIGFGSRYAGGCTAGHSIMGIAQLAPSSIISTIGFFAGGLLSTYLIIPYIF